MFYDEKVCKVTRLPGVFWPVTNQIPSIDGLVLQTHPPAQRRGFSPGRGNILLTRRDSCPRRKSSCPSWKNVSPRGNECVRDGNECFAEGDNRVRLDEGSVRGAERPPSATSGFFSRGHLF